MLKRLFLLIVFLVVPVLVVAESSPTDMEIQFVGAASSTHPVEAARSILSFGFECTEQLGSCPMVGGKVYFENDPEDHWIMSVLTSYNLKDKPVKVYWDDSQKNSRGYCKIISVRGY